MGFTPANVIPASVCGAVLSVRMEGIRLVHRGDFNFGVNPRAKRGGEGSKRFINTTPSLTRIFTPEGPGIIRTFYRDGPTCIILLVAAVNPPSIGVVCAGIWG
jgi:hypothetical protein